MVAMGSKTPKNHGFYEGLLPYNTRSTFLLMVELKAREKGLLMQGMLTAVAVPVSLTD